MKDRKSTEKSPPKFLSSIAGMPANLLSNLNSQDFSNFRKNDRYIKYGAPKDAENSYDSLREFFDDQIPLIPALRSKKDFECKSTNSNDPDKHIWVKFL